MLARMDVLANVLGVTQLANTVLLQQELLPPWGLQIDSLARAAVHMVRRGVCWLRLEGQREPLRLVPGDVVLIAQGVSHSLVDHPKTPPRPYEETRARMIARLAARDRKPDLESNILLCAAYEFAHEGPHPLLALLPTLFHVHLDESEQHGQLQSLVRLLLFECGRNLAGAEIVVPRLVDSLFVLLVRAWLDSQPAGAAGWFGALRDPKIGRALGMLHEQPQHAWTVASLARRVGLSRAAFARRFVELVHDPPLAYLTRWRMNLAARLLRDATDSLEDVASQVGYRSATAFGKAFRRYLRVSPARYRAASRVHHGS